MRRRQDQHARLGITLIEILVVIGIIVILAAIMFPVVTYCRARGTITACLNNQKQLAAAVLQYADDYSGTTPPGVWFHHNDGDEELITYDMLIADRIKNKGVFHCPDDATQGTRSYGFNDQYVRRKQEFDGEGTPLSSISPASKYVMLTDFHNDENNLGSDRCAMSYFAPDENQQYHSGGSANNYAFFDGHAKYMKFGTITNANFIFDVHD